MKITITKVNKEEYEKSLTESLERFIAYAEEHGTKEVKFEGKMHKVPDQYGQHIELAKHLKDNLNNICLHVHNYCYDSGLIGEVIYPGKMMDSIHNYRHSCYRNREENPEKNFLSLEEQNKYTKEYVHFDFSVKRIKTLASL